MSRPDDVCALCDHAITPDQQMHMYLGKGWVHGGPREHIPVHWHCCVVDQHDPACTGYPESSPMGQSVIAYLRRWLVPETTP